MSEQKMPERYEWVEGRGLWDNRQQTYICLGDDEHAQVLVNALSGAEYAAGFEAGRQQERERLEPLRVAVEALNRAQANEAAIRGGITTCDKPLRAAHESYAAASTVIATARTLLEQTE